MFLAVFCDSRLGPSSWCRRFFLTLPISGWRVLAPLCSLNTPLDPRVQAERQREVRKFPQSSRYHSGAPASTFWETADSKESKRPNDL